MREIAVVTGTRAEYGLLKPLLTRIQAHPDLTLRLIVTGAHLDPAFGNTVGEIEADGFPIAARVHLELGEATGLGAARAVAEATRGLAEALARTPPAAVVLLGDRYEILGAASAALTLGVPIAHVHGGEVTEGAFDEQIRHAVTKMAHLHFVCADAYRRRVIQMGEQPETVFDVGALALDVMTETETLIRSDTLTALGLENGEHYLLVTWHPETVSPDRASAHLGALLDALRTEARRDTRIVITGVNADPGHDLISAEIAAFAARLPNAVRRHASLGSRLYINAMRHADSVVGNSSSGILEAPSLGVPTVNVGDRQKGRLRAPSVVDCAADKAAIEAALAEVRDPAFRKRAKRQASPFGTPGAAARIADALAAAPLARHARKRFYDLTEHGPA